MKLLALAAAGTAVLGLASCSASAAPDATPAAHRTPISCSEQYRTWTHGAGKGVMHALAAVTSATTGSDAHALAAALKKARPKVARAAEQPIPACADPRGYWSVLLMHVNPAVAGDGSSSSVRAALRDVPKIHHQLLSEVRQTVG
ncbi:MAG TPA: hypothetical protein VFJ09_00385 [Nocardioidaceae bacterium]|nr:hypothetical protein [Nocardioidaceae bacterium]